MGTITEVRFGNPPGEVMLDVTGDSWVIKAVKKAKKHAGDHAPLIVRHP